MSAAQKRWTWRRVRRVPLRGAPPAPPTAAGLDVAPTDGSKRLERECLALCAELGLPAFHDRDPRHNASGLPDVLTVAGPALLLPEFKSQRRYPTPEQRRWLEALAGVTHLWSGVVRPADWPAFRALVVALAQGTPPDALWTPTTGDDADG